MAKKGPKKKQKKIDYSDPHSMVAYKAAFCEWMTINHYSPHTLRTRCNCLDIFIAWCEERGVTQAQEVNRAILEQYRRFVYHYRTKYGKPLSLQSQCGRLIAIRVFFKWLAKRNDILFNPASELELPRLEKRLPDNIPNRQEIEHIINQPKVNESIGLRDRAILETLYSTGMRRTECCNLKLYDLEMDKGTVKIRLGKGRKDRVVPIGNRALAWIEKYQIQVRPQWVMEPDEGELYITIDGDPISEKYMTHLAHEYVKQADIGKQGSCHIFRHAMATHMLENGADIRIIQAILGHECLNTTEIYTHVSIDHIKSVHSRTHPARLDRQEDAQNTQEDTQPPTETDTLLSALAAEADADE